MIRNYDALLEILFNIILISNTIQYLYYQYVCIENSITVLNVYILIWKKSLITA